MSVHEACEFSSADIRRKLAYSTSRFAINFNCDGDANFATSLPDDRIFLKHKSIFFIQMGDPEWAARTKK